MKLVDDIGSIWKRWSVRIVAAQVVLIATWAAFSAVGLAPDVANWIKWTIVGVFSAAALTAANLQQKNLPKP
jgi:hypothetical protein